MPRRVQKGRKAWLAAALCGPAKLVNVGCGEGPGLVNRDSFGNGSGGAMDRLPCTALPFGDAYLGGPWYPRLKFFRLKQSGSVVSRCASSQAAYAGSCPPPASARRSRGSPRYARGRRSSSPRSRRILASRGPRGGPAGAPVPAVRRYADGSGPPDRLPPAPCWGRFRRSLPAGPASASPTDARRPRDALPPSR